MAVTTQPRADRPPGLHAATVAEAFQATAAAHPERVALRTKGDELSITWREYADKVRETGAGLAGLGLERGHTMALMLTNRPEFHWFRLGCPAPRRHAVLALQHVHDRADPVPGV